MVNLFELVLSYNFITEIPNTIGLLRNMRIFYADENDITHLPPDVSFYQIEPGFLFDCKLKYLFEIMTRADWMLHFTGTILPPRQQVDAFTGRNRSLV
jgi:Leucine-rich repeat (LRR) protein